MKKLIYSIAVLAVGIFIGSQIPVSATTHPKLIQTVCEKGTNGKRIITYFWDDGSSDIYSSAEKVGGGGLGCAESAHKTDLHFHADYPPSN